MGAEMSQAEIARRVAVLRRFKALLGQQRERFRNYLALLENQETVIGSGSGEEILAHVELEGRVVADIFSTQRVIRPLEDMYLAAAPRDPADDGVSSLKTALEDLKAKAQAQSAKNRELLSVRMAGIRAEMNVLKDSPFVKSARSVYGDVVAPSLVDVKG